MSRLLVLTVGFLPTVFFSRLADAQMQYPLSVAAAEDGTLYVADRNLPGVWIVKEGKPEIYFKGSKQFRTPLNAVRCVAMDEKGRLLAGDSSTREVYRFDKERKPVPLTDGGIGIPMAIAVAANGEIYVADLELHRIWKVPALGGKPEEVAVITAPRGMTIDSDNRLWIVSHGKNQVVRLNPDKTVETVVKGQPFDFPHNIVLDGEGGAFVIDGYAKTLWKVAADGTTSALHTGEPFKNPVGLAIRDKTLYIADPHKKAIYASDFSGKVTQVAPAK